MPQGEELELLDAEDARLYEDGLRRLAAALTA
jgi:hypothetical protein